jgi:hypothetical protein
MHKEKKNQVYMHKFYYIVVRCRGRVVKAVELISIGNLLKWKYHTVETVPKSRKAKKYHTVRTVPKSRKTKNTTLSEQFQNLEKQKLPHILELFWQCDHFCFLDFGTVLTVWYFFAFLDFGTVSTVW